MKRAAGVLIVLSTLFAAPHAWASSPPALPATTSWTDAGLQEMVRLTGPISVSISGAGFNGQGAISVVKPAGSTVIAAYLSTANHRGIGTVPTGVELNGSVVTYTHKAFTNNPGDTRYKFTNHFADVTALVKTTIDAGPSGILSLTLNETGTSPSSSNIDGSSLVVVFDDPSKPVSSVVLMFGTSGSTPSAFDSFTVSFPAIQNVANERATLSLGISHSSQLWIPANPAFSRAQRTIVEFSTSSNVNPRTASLSAGGRDDGADAQGALLTVGGIGDSRGLPNLNATLPNATEADFNDSADDELYGLDSFLAVGDTSLTVRTQNSPGFDDNLFQAVLYFEGVGLTGATTVGSTPTVSNVPATWGDTWPSMPSIGGSDVPPVSHSAVAPVPEKTLAATGANRPQTLALTVTGAVLVLVGSLILWTRRKFLALNEGL